MCFSKIKQMWVALYADDQDITPVIKTFFHPQYSQIANGVERDLNEFIMHVIEQKKNFKKVSINYKTHLEKDNQLFAIYDIQGENNHREPIVAEVIAYFEFKNNLIFRVHAQALLSQGKKSDVDIED